MLDGFKKRLTTDSFSSHHLYRSTNMGNKLCKPVISQVVEGETEIELIQWGITTLRKLVMNAFVEEKNNSSNRNSSDDITQTLKKQALALARDQLGESVQLFEDVDIPFTETMIESAFQHALFSTTQLSMNPSFEGPDTPISDTYWYQCMENNNSTVDEQDEGTKHDHLMVKAWSFMRQRISAETRNKVCEFLRNHFVRSPPWAVKAVEEELTVQTSVRAYINHLMGHVFHIMEEQGASKSTLRALTVALAILCVDGLSPLRGNAIMEDDDEEDETETFLAEFQNWYEFIRPLVEMLGDAYLHPRKWIRSQLQAS